MTTNAKEFLQYLSEHSVDYVNFNFTDTSGRLHGITKPTTSVTLQTLEVGIPFDGSSVTGWAHIESSDMLLLPDLQTACRDPFSSYHTMSVICSIGDTSAEKTKLYSRDPRHTVMKVEQFLKDSGIADSSFCGNEVEFFVFDDVRYSIENGEVSYKVDPEESVFNSNRSYEYGNRGHHTRPRMSYSVSQPMDSMFDLRTEILEVFKKVNLTPTMHHHEVGAGQSEVGFRHASPLIACDNVVRAKHVIRNTVASYGKSATFLPKPLCGDVGSGMHCHLSLWRDQKNLFTGDRYANLSELGLFFIGGILKHIRAICALTNPITNSYKRFRPGFEAPVVASFSYRNRSAALRIPYVHHPDSARVECRFPDPSMNPYLGTAALLMAGIDGILNRIEAPKPLEKNTYSLSQSESAQYSTVSRTLTQALDALENDHQFLLAGGVFTAEQIQHFIQIKRKEVEEVEFVPHPMEFYQHFSC